MSGAACGPGNGARASLSLEAIDQERHQGSPPLTVADVANHLGVSEDVARDLLRKRKLHGGKVGGQWRIRPEDLAEYVMATFERS